MVSRLTSSHNLKANFLPKKRRKLRSFSLPALYICTKWNRSILCLYTFEDFRFTVSFPNWSAQSARSIFNQSKYERRCAVLWFYLHKITHRWLHNFLFLRNWNLVLELSQLAGYNLYGKEEVPAGGIVTGTVLRSRIRDPVPIWLLDPGWAKKSRSGSGIQIRDEHPGSYFRELGNNFLGYKYCNSLMRIRIRAPESEILDKYPGSATLHM